MPDHANWSPDHWRTILLSGESQVIMFGGKGSRSYQTSKELGI